MIFDGSTFQILYTLINNTTPVILYFFPHFKINTSRIINGITLISPRRAISFSFFYRSTKLSNIFRWIGSFKIKLKTLLRSAQTSQAVVVERRHWWNSSTSVSDFSGGGPELAMVQVTPYQCPKCFKYFKSSKSWCNHRGTCGTDKKFGCAFCDYRSHQKGNVLRHLVTQHREASKKKRINYVLRVDDRWNTSFPSNT